MNTFADFKNAIGQKFKVVDDYGKPYSGVLGKHDTIIAVNANEQTVEGKFLIAHFSICRLIQEQPAQLKK